MRTVKWNAFLSGLCGFAVALGGWAVSARADVTIDKGASILIFPKVIADGTFDTIIQITNTSNQMAMAHCFYVDNSQGLCQETDFTITLTKQQPTHWLVSGGRPDFLTLPGSAAFGGNDAGIALYHVPPVAGFRGELKCVQVAPDGSGDPWAGNDLKGEATLIAVRHVDGLANTGDVSKYNAVGLQAIGSTPTNPLTLDGTDNYEACPERLIVNHFASGSPDPVIFPLAPGADAINFTFLTLVPCKEDFENQIPTKVTVQFAIYNEFELRFSASKSVTCWADFELTTVDSVASAIDLDSSVFSFAVLGTPVAHTEVTPVIDTKGNSSGLVGVVERLVAANPDAGGKAELLTRAAYNLHGDGEFTYPKGPDTILLPLQ